MEGGQPRAGAPAALCALYLSCISPTSPLHLPCISPASALAQVLLPRYVPRAGKETLLHLAFWARVEKMHSVERG